MTSNVTIVQHVEDGPGVTQYPSVTEWNSTVAGAIPWYVDLMTGGVLLLMTGGGLLQVNQGGI